MSIIYGFCGWVVPNRNEVLQSWLNGRVACANFGLPFLDLHYLECWFYGFCANVLTRSKIFLWTCCKEIPVQIFWCYSVLSLFASDCCTLSGYGCFPSRHSQTRKRSSAIWAAVPSEWVFFRTLLFPGLLNLSPVCIESSAVNKLLSCLICMCILLVFVTHSGFVWAGRQVEALFPLVRRALEATAALPDLHGLRSCQRNETQSLATQSSIASSCFKLVTTVKAYSVGLPLLSVTIDWLHRF
jgi:hypothetical protein